LSGAEMKQIIEDNGLKCTSSHFNSGELNESLNNRIEWAQEIKMKQMILSSFGLAKDASVDDYRKAADYFRNNPGRFISAHLADYSPEKETQVPLGQGIVDWKDFFIAAKEGGVKNFYVEMDPETFKPSAEFLKEV